MDDKTKTQKGFLSRVKNKLSSTPRSTTPPLPVPSPAPSPHFQSNSNLSDSTPTVKSSRRQSTTALPSPTSFSSSSSFSSSATATGVSSANSNIITPFPTANLSTSSANESFPSRQFISQENSHDETGSNDERDDGVIQENYKYSVIKNDASLREIGERMRAIHNEVQSIEDNKIKEFTKTELPQMRQTIKTLQKEIEMLKSRALIEKDEGQSHLKSISADISKNENKISELQSRIHFPFTNFVMGGDGIYGSCSDIWVENISGRVEINVIHSNAQSPSKLSLNFLGPNGPQEGGLTMKLKVIDFKLKSEIATIPSVSFQELKWDVIVKIRAVLSYALKRTEKTSRMGHWVCPSTDFELEVVTITAPISLDARLVSALLKPQLLKIVLSILPRELGDIVTPFGGPQTECSILGNFSLIGTKMDLMSRKMVFSREVCQLVASTPTQLAVFRFMQKSVNTPTRIKTMDDLIAYVLKYRNSDRWTELITLWQQAIDIYTAKLTTLPPSSMSHPIPSPLRFENLLSGAGVLLKKPVQLCIQLSQLHCQVSLRKIMLAYYSWKDHRVEKAAEKLIKKGLMKSSGSEEYCTHFHIRRRREHHERTALLTIMATFLSTVMTDTSFRLHSGDDISLRFDRISATLPVVHLANFPVNPFSTTLPLFLSFLLKKFKPTETESVIVSMTDENTVDVRMVSSLQTGTHPPQTSSTGNESSTDREEEDLGERLKSTLKTPLKAVGEKFKSITTNSPLNTYINEASAKAGTLLSHFQHSDSSAGDKKPSPGHHSNSRHRKKSFDETSNADTHQELLHLVLSGVSSGLALSNEWGRTADSGTIQPGQTIFSVQIDESFRPNQLTLDSHVTAAYRMISQCSTRPLISKFVRTLPELKNGATLDTLRTTVGGWPVCMRVNDHFRVGVDIRCLSCTLNLISTLECLNCYVNNPAVLSSVRELNEETLLNLQSSVKRLNKYLAREGVDVDTHLSYHFETIPIQSPLLRKRYGGVEEDVILTLTSSASSSSASSQEIPSPINTPEMNKKEMRRRSLSAAQPLSQEGGGGYALNLRLELDIWDVVEDMMAISQFVIQASTENNSSSS